MAINNKKSNKINNNCYSDGHRDQQLRDNKAWVSNLFKPLETALYYIWLTMQIANVYGFILSVQ